MTEKLIHALESRRPRARYFVTDADAGDGGGLRRLLPTRVMDWMLTRA